MFLSSAVSWLSGPARWLDLSRTTEPLMAGAMQAGDWAPLGTSVLLWVVLPLTVGCWRLVRREVK
jgi:ABC-2 type transport system permease protein